MEINNVVENIGIDFKNLVGNPIENPVENLLGNNIKNIGIDFKNLVGNNIKNVKNLVGNNIKNVENPVKNPLENPVSTNIIEIKPIFERKDYRSFDIYGKNKNKPENVIFGKIEIFFENRITKIKLHTIFFPSEYAKKWLRNNKERLGSEAHGQKDIHKYKKYSLFKIDVKEYNFDKVVETNVNKDEMINNVNIHMKEIIQKLNTRTRHEYIFTPNKL